MSFLKILFARRQTKPKSKQEARQPTQAEGTLGNRQSTSASKKDGIPQIISLYRESYKDQSLKNLNDMYFTIIGQIAAAEKEGKIDELLMHCQASLALLESLIKYCKKEYGRFDIKTIPALDKGLIYFAINGNTRQLKNIQDVVNYFDELHTYADDVETAFARRELAAKIFRYVKANSNCRQTDLKRNLNLEDGCLISTTVHYMEKAGKLKRIREGGKILLSVHK
ncbi:MAG: hypothetical protein RIG68_24065 [Imperialibacter sp.]|uniref:hypothetical protein n=1 Tax=Imperialibacter sp. TaxID=2038411 RepID=UPI0032EB0C25